ncbi:MAG: hypothetical protein MJZ31_08240 [Bacteroidales bacterium]|nr:hypothetical protein [Bacteroidales bacterium]
MNGEITQENLYLLLPGKVTDTSVILAREKNEGILEAMLEFYHSETYKKLEKEETKMWHYGPVALSEEFEERG